MARQELQSTTRCTANTTAEPIPLTVSADLAGPGEPCHTAGGGCPFSVLEYLRAVVWGLLLYTCMLSCVYCGYSRESRFDLLAAISVI